MCESKAVNNECHDDTPEFRIENKILIGREVPLYEEPVNVAEVALEMLKSKPDIIGQVDALTGEVHTYADMSERSIKCALWLRKQGVKPGDIIGLCTDNNLNSTLILLGIMYTGTICNTWDHVLSTITARYFLTLTSPKIVFAIKSSAANLREVAKRLKMDMKIVTIDHQLDGYEFFEDILKGHDPSEVAEFKCTAVTNPKDVCLIVPSSGTTGMPKGTEISHYSIYNCLHPVKIEHMKDQICMFASTLRWHYGVLLAFKTIVTCSTRIITPDDDNAVAMCEFIEKYRVTWFGSDPFMLIKFLKNDLLEKYRLPSLKTITSTGAHLKKEFHEALLAKLPHISISNMYGMTDAGTICSYQTSKSKYGSIGFVAESARIRIVDVDDKNLGPNEIGEIRLKVPNVMNGYYKNPEMTKQAFDSDGWLRSADLGYYDDDGNIFMVDRMSHFINFRSINVSPGEIEAVLNMHPAVLQVVVIGIPHEVDEQHPMAVVCRMSGKTVTEDELIDLVEKNIPDHCRLRGGVKFLEDFPRTATGKIAMKQLKQMFIK